MYPEEHEYDGAGGRGEERGGSRDEQYRQEDEHIAPEHDGGRGVHHDGPEYDDDEGRRDYGDYEDEEEDGGRYNRYRQQQEDNRGRRPYNRHRDSDYYDVEDEEGGFEELASRDDSRWDNAFDRERKNMDYEIGDLIRNEEEYGPDNGAVDGSGKQPVEEGGGGGGGERPPPPDYEEGEGEQEGRSYRDRDDEEEEEEEEQGEVELGLNQI